MADQPVSEELRHRNYAVCEWWLNLDEIRNLGQFDESGFEDARGRSA